MASADNFHVRDARVLFGIGQSARDRGDHRAQLIEAALFSALGVDRLLKAVLHEINPLYAYLKQDFGHSLPTHYAHRLLPGVTKGQELEKSPSSDLCGMKTAAHRAGLTSSAVRERLGAILNLANLRDVIAHRNLGELEDDKLRTALNDIFEIVFWISRELELEEDLLDDTEAARAAEQREREAPARVEQKLDAHRARFEQLEKVAGHIAAADARTEKELRESRNVAMECPACGNTGVPIVEVDYDWDGEESYPIGASVVHFHCYFCELDVDDYHEIDRMGFNDKIHRP